MRSSAALALCLLLPACASASQGGGAGAGPAREGGAPRAVEDGAPPRPAETSYAREGAYAGIAAILGFEQFDEGRGIGADDSRFGMGLRGGWRTKEGYAAEVILEDASDFELRSRGASADLDIWSFGVQGKYYFDDGRAQPYFLAGFGVAQVDLDRGGEDEGLYLRLGGGVEYYLKEDVALFGEIDINELMGGAQDFDHVDFQVGLVLHF